MKIIIKDEKGKTVIEREIKQEEVVVKLNVKEGTCAMVSEESSGEYSQAYH